TPALSLRIRKLGLSRKGRVLTLRTAVRLNRAALLRVRVLTGARATMRVLPGSFVGPARTGRLHRTLAVPIADGTTTVTLRVRQASTHVPPRLRVVFAADDGAASRATATVAFRR